MAAGVEKDTRTLRVAVIGVGQRAAIAHHIGATGTPAALVAAVDTTEAGRVRAVAAFGPTVQVLPSVADALAAVRLDAAVVTTPDDTHAAIAMPLLEAGVAVYLEKPMAITVEDCDLLLETAARTGTPLYVGHNMRHMSVVRQMKVLIDAGEIGEVKSIWCRHFVGNGGDYYFKDWHAERAHVHSLLLQKASHDLDVIHWLAGRATRRVTALGALTVYGDHGSRRGADHAADENRLMADGFSYENWPPETQTELNPVIDVEDVSMMLMDLGDGVTASYEQCHFTPDYWRNYTVIGTRGRLENFGDTPGGVIRIWNRRRAWSLEGDLEVPIEGEGEGHEQADALTMGEFLRHVATGAPTTVTAVAARDAVAAGALAALSLRDGGTPRDIPPLPPGVRRP
ncbi:Gfo/Idh/MocA family protein [uncultured Amnibacterium sp.]|uniref:Gfo/Idh/MocA family protein n=1 Tax=uncultured Amnibacterium sp. TaxID=1631851 RepID=UPI0035C9559F